MANQIINAFRTLAGITPAAPGVLQATGGPEGEQFAAEIHGKWYHRAKAGQLFKAATALAGTIIPVNAATLNSTFTLLNPLGSGVNLELARYKLGIAGTTTAVIGHIALAFQASPTAFTSITLGTIQNCLLGSGTAAKSTFYTGATFTGTPTILETLGLSFGTTGAQPGPITAVADIDGDIIVPPNCAITIVGNAAQTQAMAQSLTFAEVPTP